MIEKQIHLDAFEYFYSLGGAATDKNVSKMSVKCQVSERTIWRWYKEFGWKERVQLRDIDVQKRVEKKTNETIADNKAKYLSYVHKLFDDWKRKVDQGHVPVEIKSVSDVDKVVKLGLLLQDEATEKNVTIVNTQQGMERLRRIEANHVGSSPTPGRKSKDPKQGEPGTTKDPPRETRDK